jgi:hypothetical protein
VILVIGEEKEEATSSSWRRFPSAMTIFHPSNSDFGSPVEDGER